MTLLLGPPGAGKTTLLLALAGKLDDDLRVKFSPSLLQSPLYCISLHTKLGCGFCLSFTIYLLMA